jgi:hypothetical protein
VTRGKQLFGERLSDSGTTTCDYVVFHCVQILGVMIAQANGNERLKRNVFVANKSLCRQRAFFEHIKRGSITLNARNLGLIASTHRR